MKLLSKQFLILFLISTTIIACDKEEDDAVPTTPTTNNNGGNTGGVTTPNQPYYITGKQNGKTFLSTDDSRFTYASLFSIAAIRQHQLIGTGDSIGAASLSFQKKDGKGFDGVGRYDFKNNQDASMSLSWIPGDRRVTYNADNTKYNDGHVDGFVDVTFYDSTIIEGTFAFKAVNPDWSDPQNPDYSDSVRITDGRFKLKYR